MNNSSSSPMLPPNPYTRQPIKKRKNLAGRAQELKTIRYYLKLTAAGQSPHLALIGERGVGKTSLLNCAESIARDLNLLPIRINMNEQKGNSPGRFWQDFYSTLALSMAKANCWGGIKGPIYEALFKMIHSGQTGSLDEAVLQIPYTFSCYQGNLDQFECSDALVEYDLKACLAELETKGFTGIAFLIDEADCLGKNVPLLQMFRNIFQTVERCSLILSGTDAVFPALSEVFSPIPRQFHRIDIKRFLHGSDTMQLVEKQLPQDIFEDVAPKINVTRDLHELCSGDPAEVQLYCHHMYRAVEDGTATRMSLAPQVFREVLREYRSITPANLDGVLNAIERLPNRLLYESLWTSRRALTLTQNIQVEKLIWELKHVNSISTQERNRIQEELKTGYQSLFEKGITEAENCLRLSGDPLTGGFWKSFVNLERGERWTWDDSSFGEILHGLALLAMGTASGAVCHIGNMGGGQALSALQSMRKGGKPGEINSGMGDMIATTVIAHAEESTHVADIEFQFDSPGGKQKLLYRFLEKPGNDLEREQFEGWIEKYRSILAGNDIAITLISFYRWMVPSSQELHRLGFSSEFSIPDLFGPSALEQAIAQFVDGDIQGCSDIFLRILEDKDDPQIRNNLGFCQLLLGQVDQAFENTSKAVSTQYEPLYELNKGLAEFLKGNSEDCRQSLLNAYEQYRTPSSKFDPSTAAYVLLLEPTKNRVRFEKDLPTDAAILFNLLRMGHFSNEQLETALTKLYPDKAPSWLKNIGTQ